ncbi:MAG: isopentenyl-diphosphate Delta-isomerase [Flammeovirgaceae bacterium]|nr:MAG: isopentenyl-diphosphate Delta-isomerase [Flammeovirgaceae bacterium]
MEHVILVDEHDNEVGTMEKMEAHQKGVLHRAFSVLVFNSKGEMLIQKRADCKYHSGGLWTNTCCSHPRPGERIEEAAKRRLQEEMGILANPEKAYSFIYKTQLDGGLTEHELDHVLFAYSDSVPDVNYNEVQDWQFISIAQLKQRIKKNPELFTYWFRLIINHPQINSTVSA